ncbi:AAA family ATPase [Pyxidicoccus xibeiensis]|uniref:AAA family ATPase n=1 Tax=Pyxidicoccus xibeiensis TaxID=2906759 RepID=UPI0020A711A9|nr:AAA family ATPase [Pyxidicoccus xibeiensis]MCP3144046.1 ATP-binding protein [Pyxidicoccus xibeiensis]
MRIAFSGSHRCGKSTLIADVEERLDGYRVVDEPYLLLEEEGYEFAHPPSMEDFVEQLRCALALADEEGTDLLLDRCPVDFLGYLLAHPDAESFELEEWMDRVRSAVQRLDLIVFVPIEEPDRIRLPRSEDADMRSEVDARLKWLLLEDPYQLGVEVLTVEGRRPERVEQVLRQVIRRDRTS